MGRFAFSTEGVEKNMSEPVCGSLHLGDEEFEEAFASCRLPTAAFHHPDHIRLAWNFLRPRSEPEASPRTAESVRRFATHNGMAEKFPVTMTRAWMRLVAAALKATPEPAGFAEFMARQPHLLARDALSRRHSTEGIERASARVSWIEPGLDPLPPADSSPRA
jgi:hypothetical protein